MRVARSIGLLALLAFPCMSADRASELEQVVETERAFAARAQEVNVRRAFVEYFAPDAVMFSPFAGPAFPALAEGPDWAVNIDWRPVAAAVSGAGDMGYTTGPAEYRRKPDEAPVAFGHYTSVWQRQADGQYRVRIDIGIDHPAPPGRVSDWKSSGASTVAAATVPESKREEVLRELRGLDARLGAMGSEHASAIAEFLSDEARLHYSGHLPFVGRSAFLKALQSSTGEFDWQPEGGAIAASADFGYLFGRGHYRSPEGTSGELAYLDIWQRSGTAWRLLAQVVRPIRPRSTN